MVLVSIAAGFIVAVAASGAGDLSPAAQPWEPIRVLSSVHRIDFPNEVVFFLEAEADAQITEVSLFYRLGRQKVRIYGYPSFTPSTRVSADFRVKTGGASYLPSGVDIEYHYVIRDADGNTLETDNLYLEYIDPSYDWRRFSQGDLTILWHDLPRDRVVAVAAEVAPRLDEVRGLLGLESVGSMKAVIFNSRREGGRGFPLISDAANSGHIYGGFAFGYLDVFVLVGLDRDGIVHEMTHLLLDEALDSPLASVPAWLNEGLAMYFEVGSRTREETVAQAVRADRLLSVRSMGNVPGSPQDVRLFYAQAQSLVRYIMDVHGPEPMAALLGALNRGLRIDEAVSEAYGMSLEELEGEWLADFVPGVTLAPLVDPGTFGTSLIIAAAVAVTAVAVLIRWLRRSAYPPEPEDAEL